MHNISCLWCIARFSYLSIVMFIDKLISCISGFVERRFWNFKFMQNHDGKRRMSAPHGCFWSSGRVSMRTTNILSHEIWYNWTLNLLLFLNFYRFTVEADKPIKDWTIITEYAGDVDYLKNRENDDGDSIMTLLSAADPSKSLVICPDKYGNIARYINGINNHTRLAHHLLFEILIACLDVCTLFQHMKALKVIFNWNL